MNLLVKQNSFGNTLGLKYYEIISRNPSSLSIFTAENRSLLLSKSECNFLYKKTFLSENYPFGLINKVVKTGVVETNENRIHHFNRTVEKSLAVIKNIPAFHDLLKNCIRCVIPLGEASQISQMRKDGSGFSAHWLKGAIFLSLPQEHPFPELELAINLVHELGHQVLMFFQDADALIEKDFAKPIYSAIRKTSRPAIMSLHALVAIHFMNYFINELLRFDSSLNDQQKSYLLNKKRQLSCDFATGCFALKGVDFTPIGAEIMLEMIEYFREARVA